MASPPKRPEVFVDHAQGLGRLTALARATLPAVEVHADERAHQAYLRVRQRLAQRPVARVSLRALRLRLWWIPLAVATGMLLSVGVYRGLRSDPLTYTVEGGMVAEGGYVRAPATTDTGVRFSDGTEVELARASRGRVAWTSPRGARVMLDQGRARVKVVPRRGNEWVFDAGPCLVHVTGTRFDMRWSASEQLLEVLLYDGSVTVQGPPAPRGIVMHEGQRLVMDVRHHSVKLDEIGPAAGGPAEEPAKDPAILGLGAVGGSALASASPAAAPLRAAAVTIRGASRDNRRPASWSARVLAGDFSSVLREARRRGVDEVLRHDGPGEVMALAQAARYSRERALARRSLTAVRSRFPDSAASHKAAFLLGRMAEDDEGDLARALEWYARYLREARQGTYRDEALGRQMTATQLLRGSPAARPIAEEYLRLFPTGAYGKPARAILRAPR